MHKFMVLRPHLELVDLLHLFEFHVPILLWFYDQVTTELIPGVGSSWWLGQGKAETELESFPLQDVPSSASYVYPLRQWLSVR